MPVGPGLYSRVVAVLKVGLPLVAVGLLASLFLVQTDDRLGGNVVFSPGDVEALGSGLRIDNPTFTGTTRSDDRFRFTAAVVEPDAAPPTRARITTLDGTLDLHDGPVVTVSAKAGDLDIPTQRLDLSGQVVVPPVVVDGTLFIGTSLEADSAYVATLWAFTGSGDPNREGS